MSRFLAAKKRYYSGGDHRPLTSINIDPDAIYRRAKMQGRTSRSGLTNYYRGTNGIRSDWASRYQAPRSQIRAANVRTGGLLGIEVKYLDAPRTGLALVAPTDATGGEVPPSSVVTGCLSAPAQGSGPTNREGKKIMIKSIFVNGVITTPAAEGVTNARNIPSVYIALVLDTQTNGVTINSEDVFINQVAATGAATNVQRNMSFVSRFKVLKTWKYTCPQLPIANAVDINNFAYQGTNMPFELSKKFKDGIPVNFTTASTTADVANVIDNSLHIIAFTNYTEMAPTIAFNSRMRFVG